MGWNITAQKCQAYTSCGRRLLDVILPICAVEIIYSRLTSLTSKGVTNRDRLPLYSGPLTAADAHGGRVNQRRLQTCPHILVTAKGPLLGPSQESSTLLLPPCFIFMISYYHLTTAINPWTLMCSRLPQASVMLCMGQDSGYNTVCYNVMALFELRLSGRKSYCLQ